MESLDIYMREMSHPVLSREQEHEIGLKVEADRKSIIAALARIPRVADIIGEKTADLVHVAEPETEELVDLSENEAAVDYPCDPSNPVSVAYAAIGKTKPISPTNLGWETTEALTKYVSAALEASEDGAVVAEELGTSVETAKEVLSEVAAVSKRLKSQQDFIVEHNLRLVLSRAKNFWGRTPASPEDIIQNGNIGLICAAERFNFELGNKFSTYAIYWIDMKIREAGNEQHGAVRMPNHQVSQIGKLSKTESEMTNELGRTPTTRELAERMGISEERVKSIRMSSISAISLDQPISSDGDSLVSEIIGDPRSQNPLLGSIDPDEFVSDILEKATPGSRRKLCSRYGLSEFPQDVEELRDSFNFGIIAEAEEAAIAKLREMSS